VSEDIKLMKNNLRFLNALLVDDSVEIMNIYKTCFPSVRTFIIQNKGQDADAEDIFQKALLQIAVRYRKEPFEIKSTFEGYLFTACKNLWRRELNKSKKRVTYEQQLERNDEEEDQALALLEQKRWELFTDNLSVISENCKKVLELFFAKISYAEIVKKLEYSSETVARQRVFKCKAKLTDMIKNDKRYYALQQL